MALGQHKTYLYTLDLIPATHSSQCLFSQEVAETKDPQ